MDAQDEDTPGSSVKVKVGTNERDFDLGEIASTVGNALTDLFLARQQNDNIFTDENRQMVQTIARAVAKELHSRSVTGEDEAPRTMAAHEVYHIIERALIKANQHAVAKSVVVRRQRLEKDGAATETPIHQPIMVSAKVIRRNGQVVAWNHNKIEIAVRKAFLNLELDSGPAVAVAEAVTRLVAAEERQFITIEDLQNLVEEELMRQGHFKVARAYIQ